MNPAIANAIRAQAMKPPVTGQSSEPDPDLSAADFLDFATQSPLARIPLSQVAEDAYKAVAGGVSAPDSDESGFKDASVDAYATPLSAIDFLPKTESLPQQIDLSPYTTPAQGIESLSYDNPFPTDVPDTSIMHIGPVKPLDDSESLSLTKGRGAHVVDYDRMDDEQEKEIRDFTKDSVLKRGDQPIVLSRYGRINQDEYSGDDIISHPISEGSELGAHFSISRESYQDDIEYDSAKSIAKQHINSQRHDKVYQRFVTSIQNPYPMEDLDHWNAVEVADWLLMDENIPDDLARKNFEEVRRASSDISVEGIDDSPNLINRRFLKSLGYDSIKYFNDTEGRGDSYIIFDEYDVEALGGNPINLIE